MGGDNRPTLDRRRDRRRGQLHPESGELIRQEAERAGVELKVFVVGFDLTPEDAEAVRAMVDMIPGATYQDAPEVSALRSALTKSKPMSISRPPTTHGLPHPRSQ